MKTLILALGNPILSDDGVAWRVADLLAARLPAQAFDVWKESGASLDLLMKLAGYQRLIILDAIQLGQCPPGTLHRFTLEDFSGTIRTSSAHDINFATAFALGRQLGLPIPTDVRIYGIEAQDLTHFHEGCTPELSARIPELAECISAELA